jgi:hypothetical protein
MAYLLRYSGGNNNVKVSTPFALSFIGDYIEIEFEPDNARCRLFSDNGFGNILERETATRYRLRVTGSGAVSTLTTGATTGRIILRLVRTSSAYELFLNGISQGTLAGVSGIAPFNIGSWQDGLQSEPFDLYALSYFSGGSITNNYDFVDSHPDATLIDSVGTNNGSLEGFTLPEAWVFYDDGGSISASVAQTITKPVFSVSSSFVAPVTISADIAYTIAKPIFATEASKVVPTFTSDLAFNVAKPVFATTASTTVPVFTSALAVDISKPIFAVSADNGQLVITSAIAASISKPVFSVTADNQVLIINSAIALSVSKPIFSVASSNNVPTFTVSTAFDINKPIFSIASTATEPGNASASIAVLVDAPIFSVSTSLINPLLSTIDFSIDAPVFSVLNSATRPTLNAEITVDVTAPTFSVIANNGVQVYYYRSGTQVITYSQNTQIKIRTLNTNQPL